jgi:Flp pilus assembly protein TadB
MELKGLVSLVVVVVIIGTLLGAALFRSEILDPSRAAADARRINAEAAGLESKNAFEQQQQQIELDKQQALAEIDRQAAAARQQKELELLEQDHQLKARLFEAIVWLAVPVLLLAVLLLTLGGAVYLACLGIDHLQLQQRPGQTTRPQKAPVIAFRAQSR